MSAITRGVSPRVDSCRRSSRYVAISQMWPANTPKLIGCSGRGVGALLWRGNGTERRAGPDGGLSAFVPLHPVMAARGCGDHLEDHAFARLLADLARLDNDPITNCSCHRTPPCASQGLALGGRIEKARAGGRCRSGQIARSGGQPRYFAASIAVTA